MVSAVLSTLVCTLLTAAPAPAPGPHLLSIETNCDGFGYVCGQTLPLCGCGCVLLSDSCMKQAKDDGLVAQCDDPDGRTGYCAK
jgi:hypothetical protein